jgi:rfaE bifunctional protein kinase chain/domain
MRSSLARQYGHKVKKLDQIMELVGPFPRDKKVIMCHGVFDVVHPGHLRHLLYAKSKADILIASITADKHITKGLYRPHVPQDLRALNLAALEVVDYVLIDPEAKPIKNIAALQPDFFAKGYEYVSRGMPSKTQEEVDIIEGYGGRVIFTPGDIVYSSSRLINLAPPDIGIEKLLSLMESEGITFERLREVLAACADRRVHVVGDTIVDSYTQTTMIGGQTKTPTLSVLFESRTDFIGGAGIVAKHLRAAGAEVTFSTVLGDDAYKDFVLKGLRADGVDVRAVIDPGRPTVNKNAIVAEGYRLLKIDTLDNRSISDGTLESLTSTIAEVPCDGIVFSDFRHGIFNQRTIGTLISAIPAGIFKVADSQVASRWGNITEFQGFDLITPNEREARFALGDQDSGIRPLAALLYDKARCKSMILKLGSRGALVCRDPQHESVDSFFVLDSFADHVVDAVGAGDALLAYATLAMLSGGSEVVAAILGIMAAACECERDGNVPVTPDDVLRKLDKVENAVALELGDA